METQRFSRQDCFVEPTLAREIQLTHTLHDMLRVPYKVGVLSVTMNVFLEYFWKIINHIASHLMRLYGSIHMEYNSQCSIACKDLCLSLSLALSLVYHVVHAYEARCGKFLLQHVL